MAGRPDMRDYFRARIDWHVHGLMATSVGRLPRDVAKVDGDVTSRVITVTTRSGETFTWEGGRYASRKVNGCYAPLMPRKVS